MKRPRRRTLLGVISTGFLATGIVGVIRRIGLCGGTVGLTVNG